MPDTVYFESGDDITENSLATVLSRSNTGDYVETGLDLTADYANNDLDITSGMAVIQDGTQTYVVLPDSRADLALTDAAVNHVFLDYDPSVDDALAYHIDTDDTPPSSTSLKIGEVDTSASTTTPLNRAPDVAVDALEVAGRRLDGDDDGVLENADVDALTALAAGDAFSGYPLTHGTDTDTPASVHHTAHEHPGDQPATSDITDDGSTVIYDYSASHIPSGVVEALANLTGGDAFSGYPIGSSDISSGAVTNTEIADAAVVEQLVDSPNGHVPTALLGDTESAEISVPVPDTETLKVYRWGVYKIGDETAPTGLQAQLLDGGDTVQASANTTNTESTDPATPIASYQNSSGSLSVFKLRANNATGNDYTVDGVGAVFGYMVE